MKIETNIKYTNFTPEKLYSMMYHAEQEGAYVAFIRGQFCATLDDFYKEVSAAMRFPYYFGWNWSAFDECITDLEWLKFSSLLIIIEDYKYIFNACPGKEDQKKLLKDYLIRSIEEWTSQGVPVSVYLNNWSEAKK